MSANGFGYALVAAIALAAPVVGLLLLWAIGGRTKGATGTGPPEVKR